MMRVLSPYRAQAPESGAHKRLGPFDWVGALEMLRASVARSCKCETAALTDFATDVGRGPAIRFSTDEPRLMLWILEASLRYLRSSAFDRDTVFVSPDTLVAADLRPYFAGDLALLVRTNEKYERKPILNAVQWWPVASRARLCDFYAAALGAARALPAPALRWGADSEALRLLVAPVARGLHLRAGLRVQMHEAAGLMLPGGLLNAGRRPPAPIVDFKGGRKHDMAAYYRQARWCA